MKFKHKGQKRLEKHELEAIKTIASFDCTGTDCYECPYNIGDGKQCLSGLACTILDEYAVTIFNEGEDIWNLE